MTQSAPEVADVGPPEILLGQIDFVYNHLVLGRRSGMKVTCPIPDPRLHPIVVEAIGRGNEMDLIFDRPGLYL
jgi:hypothetical protein